ncbi:Membrane transport protein [Dillenia turbinata]|uniref:Membrane transport protein n=1 Tax=Dillenia turbinata TaxID=194707 RepID=A0AAN8V442_9MAGN
MFLECFVHKKQAALPEGIVPFVFAKEYNVHPDVLSTGLLPIAHLNVENWFWCRNSERDFRQMHIKHETELTVGKDKAKQAIVITTPGQEVQERRRDRGRTYALTTGVGGKKPAAKAEIERQRPS